VHSAAGTLLSIFRAVKHRRRTPTGVVFAVLPQRALSRSPNHSETITGAQHCRAEVYLTGFGWVAMDPAGVCKAVLEEPAGNLSVLDSKVMAARKTLSGAQEGDWLAYNMARDVVLLRPRPRSPS
jgi:transglutaminase-like putative cysteine protease